MEDDRKWIEDFIREAGSTFSSLNNPVDAAYIMSENRRLTVENSKLNDTIRALKELLREYDV